MAGMLAILACCALPLLSGCQHMASLALSDKAASVSFDDPAVLSALVSKKTEPYCLVDVRTREEYSAGHIPTAVNIPYDAISETPPTKDKSALIIVYCKSGRRSAQAAAALKQLGYKRVVEFGAISRWKGPLLDSPEPGDWPATAP